MPKETFKLYLLTYKFIYLLVTCLHPPRLAPAICRQKWTLCKCELLIKCLSVLVYNHQKSVRQEKRLVPVVLRLH